MSFFDDLASITQQRDWAPVGFTPEQNQAIALNRVGTETEAAGALIGGISHLTFGLQAKKAADFQAAQLRQSATAAQAQGTRQAADIDRQGQYVGSAALATAAASGGGASDPTVVNLMARNSGEFAYRKAVALYNADDRARLMNLQADAKEFEGKNTLANSSMVAASQAFGAGTSILRGSARESTLYQRFGAGGAKSVTSGSPGGANLIWAGGDDDGSIA